MSVHKNVKRVTTNVLQEMKNSGAKISMLTGYDFSMARIIDSAGIDIILVGDSASNVMAGHETTLPITLDQMILSRRIRCKSGGKSIGGGRYAFRVVPGKFQRSFIKCNPNYERIGRTRGETGRWN